MKFSNNFNNPNQFPKWTKYFWTDKWIFLNKLIEFSKEHVQSLSNQSNFNFNRIFWEKIRSSTLYTVSPNSSKNAEKLKQIILKLNGIREAFFVSVVNLVRYDAKT